MISILNLIYTGFLGSTLADIAKAAPMQVKVAR